jgi:hypothetical protein
MERYVYLAGPISGISVEAGTAWRDQVSRLFPSHIHSISPLRDDPDYSPIGSPADQQGMVHAIQSVKRDMADVARCDLLLANFLGAQTVSIGTLAEVFWASAFHKLIVAAIETRNPSRHPFVDAVSPWIFSDLDSAVAKIVLLLADA